MKDERLDREIFDTSLEARVLIQRWRVEYNKARAAQFAEASFAGSRGASAVPIKAEVDRARVQSLEADHIHDIIA